MTEEAISYIMQKMSEWLDNNQMIRLEKTLEEENLIYKSPLRRIHRIKITSVVRETYGDEELERLRDDCEQIRNLAIIDLLNSTGMRVGELVNLDIADMDFAERECVVLGKGDKERIVYFDARTKIHLEKYLKTRRDENPALFCFYQKTTSQAESWRSGNNGQRQKDRHGDFGIVIP